MFSLRHKTRLIYEEKIYSGIISKFEPLKITKVDKYLLAEFFKNTIVALMLFVFIFLFSMLINEIGNYLDNLDKPYVNFSNIMSMYLNRVPYYSVLLSPVAFLFGTIFTLGNFYKNNEVVAVIGAGRYIFRFSLTIIIMGFLYSFFLVFLTDILVAPSWNKAESLKNYLSGNIDNLDEYDFETFGENDTFYCVKRYNSKQKILESPIVFKELNLENYQVKQDYIAQEESKEDEEETQKNQEYESLIKEEEFPEEYQDETEGINSQFFARSTQPNWFMSIPGEIPINNEKNPLEDTNIFAETVNVNDEKNWFVSFNPSDPPRGEKIPTGIIAKKNWFADRPIDYITIKTAKINYKTWFTSEPLKFVDLKKSPKDSWFKSEIPKEPLKVVSNINNLSKPDKDDVISEKLTDENATAKTVKPQSELSSQLQESSVSSTTEEQEVYLPYPGKGESETELVPESEQDVRPLEDYYVSYREPKASSKDQFGLETTYDRIYNFRTDWSKELNKENKSDKPKEENFQTKESLSKNIPLNKSYFPLLDDKIYWLYQSDDGWNIEIEITNEDDGTFKKTQKRFHLTSSDEGKTIEKYTSVLRIVDNKVVETFKTGEYKIWGSVKIENLKNIIIFDYDFKPGTNWESDFGNTGKLKFKVLNNNTRISLPVGPFNDLYKCLKIERKFIYNSSKNQNYSSKDSFYFAPNIGLLEFTEGQSTYYLIDTNILPQDEKDSYLYSYRESEKTRRLKMLNRKDKNSDKKTDEMDENDKSDVGKDLSKKRNIESKPLTSKIELTEYDKLKIQEIERDLAEIQADQDKSTLPKYKEDILELEDISKKGLGLDLQDQKKETVKDKKDNLVKDELETQEPHKLTTYPSETSGTQSISSEQSAIETISGITTTSMTSTTDNLAESQKEQVVDYGDQNVVIDKSKFFINMKDSINAEYYPYFKYRIDAEKLIWDNKLKKWRAYGAEKRFWDKEKGITVMIKIDDGTPLVDLYDNPYHFQHSFKKIDRMNLQESWRYVDKLKRAKRPFAKDEEITVYANKFAFQFSTFLIVIIGCTLGKFHSRKAVLIKSLILALAIFFTYFIFFQLGVSLGKIANVIPVMLAPWIGNIIFLFVALVMATRTKT